MELITILNRCHRFRGFVYQQAHFSGDKKSINVAVRPRKGSAAVLTTGAAALPILSHDKDTVVLRLWSTLPFAGARLRPTRRKAL